MARKTSIDQLPSAIAEIVKQYEEGLIVGADELVRKTAQKGRAALKTSSANVIGSRYAQGWRYQVEKGRLNTTATIYHTTGLPHLLEHGHALPQGGRTAARPHIAPVEEKLVTEYEKAVEDMIHDL